MQRRIYLHLCVVITSALLPLMCLCFFLGIADHHSIAYWFATMGQSTTSAQFVPSMSVSNTANVINGAIFNHSLTVTDRQVYTNGLTVQRGLIVTGELTMTHGLTVNGTVVVSGTLIVIGGLTAVVWDEPMVIPKTTITGGLVVTKSQAFLGELAIMGDLTVTDALTVFNRLSVTGNTAIVKGRLIVRGFSTYLPGIMSSIIIQADNGNFELGSVLWDEFSTSGQRLIRPAPELEVPPHSDHWAVRLGNRDNEISLIAQGVTISKENACLVYWQWIFSNDACNADYGGVGINGKWTNNVHTLCAGTATARWVPIWVDLSTYTGTTVLNFAVSNDYSVPSTMYVDDVAFYPTAQCRHYGQTAIRSALAITGSLALMVGQPINIPPLTRVK